ncbi:hypothetical protein I302_106369 [Kwoniella bestiolae CBS 10118]|uniref:Uncharacterized protein n=1 Tax=Kwoniella bestiolae CBS 10118 TaxID=1296100 RepID=A0A1B9G3U5_9TREE|nr:hypothetical protein I302_05492 [Kwoniella bestiolae CBS 10118]OCF25668.1 hypothetical protein I302_05492 [Kwoniella bestiolae CBS 10118]
MCHGFIESLFGSKKTKPAQTSDGSIQSFNPSSTLEQAVDKSLAAFEFSDFQFGHKSLRDAVLNADSGSLSDCDTIIAPTGPVSESKRSPDTDSLKSIAAITLVGDHAESDGDWIIIAKKSSLESTRPPLAEGEAQDSSEKQMTTDSDDLVVRTRAPKSRHRKLDLPAEFYEIYDLTLNPDNFTKNDYKRGARLLEGYRMPSQWPQSSQTSGSSVCGPNTRTLDEKRVDLRIAMDEVEKYGTVLVDSRYLRKTR